jgi:hypothetical protein
MERADIHVTVQGGRLLGLGSACPFYLHSYLDDTCDTYYGEALAIAEADANANVLTLHAVSGDMNAHIMLPIAETEPEEPEAVDLNIQEKTDPVSSSAEGKVIKE